MLMPPSQLASQVELSVKNPVEHFEHLVSQPDSELSSQLA